MKKLFLVLAIGQFFLNIQAHGTFPLPVGGVTIIEDAPLEQYIKQLYAHFEKEDNASEVKAATCTAGCECKETKAAEQGPAAFLAPAQVRTKIDQAFAAVKADKIPVKTQKMIKRIMLTGELEERKDDSLSMCFCYPLEARMPFIIKLVEDVLRKHPDKHKKLVYTSLGSGGLLQDYLVVQELMAAGYRNITVNIIDLEYPDYATTPGWSADERAALQESLKVAEDKRTDERAKVHDKIKSLEELKEKDIKALEEIARLWGVVVGMNTAESEVSEVKEQLRHIKIIKLFKDQLTTLAAGRTRLTINDYENVEQYQRKVAMGTAAKSDILVMIDVGGAFGILPAQYQHFITRANMLDLGSLAVFLPEYGEIEVYSTLAPDKLITPYSCLLNLISQNKKTKSRSVLVELLETCREQEEAAAKKEGREVRNFALEQWESSPELAFKDMLFAAVQPDALVYKDVTPPAKYTPDLPASSASAEVKASESDDSSDGVIVKVDPSVYKKEDVIAKIIVPHLVIDESMRLKATEPVVFKRIL